MSNELETSTEETVLETPVETIVEVIPTPEPLPELRYEYQPTDDAGRPIGNKQVIKYRTQEELTAKFAEQNTLLLRKLREETRKNRLGIPTKDTPEEAAPRFKKPVSFAPKELGEDEKAALAFRLGISPEEFDSTTDELFELKFGVKPSIMNETLQEIQQERIAQKAQTEVAAFMTAHPQYVRCPENFEAITNWMMRYDLEPVRENFKLAYNTLRDAGILIETPVEVVEPLVVVPVVAPPPVPVTEPEPVIEPVMETPPEPVEPPKVVSRIPLSLNNDNANDATGVPQPTYGSDIVWKVNVNGQERKFTGLAAIEAMPADEYRRRSLTDPTFAKKEAALEKEAAERRKRR